MTEFAIWRGLDSPAQHVRHQLHAVADAKDGNAGIEHRRIALGRAGFGDASRSAREDDAHWLPRTDFVRGAVRRPDLRINGQLAKSACDELCVLRSEIKNDDGLMIHCGRKLL